MYLIAIKKESNAHAMPYHIGYIEHELAQHWIAMPIEQAIDIKINNKRKELSTTLDRYTTKIKASRSETEKELFLALMQCIEKDTNADIDYWLMKRRKILESADVYYLF
jgi:hypothetical protein